MQATKTLTSNYPAISIREFQEKDRADVQKLFLQVRTDTFSWLDTTTYNLSAFDEETEGEYLLIAQVDDTIAGFISVWLPDSFIHHLYIYRAYQHRGIGTKLLKAAIEKLSPPITLKCWQKNTAAIVFYKKHGFTPIGKFTADKESYLLLQYKNGRMA